MAATLTNAELDAIRETLRRRLAAFDPWLDYKDARTTDEAVAALERLAEATMSTGYE